LVQQIGTASSQLAVEDRRVAEADATVDVAQAGVELAGIRQLNNVERQREWENVAPTLMVLGVFGGALGGAGSGASLSKGNPYAAAAGAVIGGISSYISGNIEQQMYANDLIRQQRELDQAAVLAGLEKTRTLIGADIARLVRFQAASTLAYAQSNLEFATAKTLNADFWFAIAKRTREFARRYLDAAIRVAYLAEQAFEFMVGRRIDRIKFDYASTQERLAADALLLDIDSIEAERILSYEQQERPIRHVISLRTRDFWAFERFKQSGSITFDTTVSEFDLAYPGTYMRRLVAVEVEVRALITPSGIRGILTKAGISWLRFDAAGGLAAGAVNVAGDWITETPTSYKIAPVLQQDQSMIFSAFDVRRDAAILRGPGETEMLRLFEGSGLGGTWQLTLQPCANEFNFDTITDVALILYFTSKYDPQLSVAVDLERQKQIALGTFITEKTKGYAFRDTLPDAYYHLLNPSKPDDWLARMVAFEALPTDFPPNEVNQRISAVILAFLSEAGPQPMVFSISSGIHSPGYDPESDNRDTLQFEGSAVAVTDPAAPNVYAFTNFNQHPADRWFLRLLAEDNPALSVTDGGGNPQRFQVDPGGHLVLDSSGQPIADPAGRLIFDDERLAKALVDVWWVFRYRYELAGPCGHPVPFWAHFDTSPDGKFAQVDGTVGSAPWQMEDTAGAWSHVGGTWQRNGGGSGFLRDGAPATWDDVELAVGVTLPAADGAEVGLISRYRSAGGGAAYRFRLISRAAAPQGVDVVIERIENGVSVELVRIDGISLPLGARQRIELVCRGGSLQGRIGGISVLETIDDVPLPAGDIGLWGAGSGAAFSQVILADLSGRT
jgi:hypothetical protein